MPKEKTKLGAAEETLVAKTAYHFPGEMKWQPQSVEAESLEEAQKIWEETRKLIN